MFNNSGMRRSLLIRGVGVIGVELQSTSPGTRQQSNLILLKLANVHTLEIIKKYFNLRKLQRSLLVYITISTTESMFSPLFKIYKLKSLHYILTFSMIFYLFNYLSFISPPRL
jgi:hypothetical protein